LAEMDKRASLLLRGKKSFTVAAQT
jgi:hypothetical protein